MSNRYDTLQSGRSVIHPTLDQQVHRRRVTEEHTFVVCADTQFGMTSMNREWQTELEYSRQAIQAINELQPRPLFCCVCGDLVDMTAAIYAEIENRSEDECNQIQDAQNEDFKKCWDDLHPDIALVCVCGNHDVGNRPTRATVQRFRTAFGDDYLAWWANGTYNIVLNTSLFSDPSGATDLYEEQLNWLGDRLHYAAEAQAGNIFVFGHHPWFLYQDDEVTEDLKGESPYPVEWGTREHGFADSYFHIPLQYRRKVMDLFKEYGVSAAFAGHFHQNLVSRSSFGMEMIVTSSLSMVFRSTGIPEGFDEPNTRGLRIVSVQSNGEGGRGSFSHSFLSI